MRILLDTHIFLWWLKGESRLVKTTKDLILSATEVYISSASIWESCIKAKLGKLSLNVDSLVNSIEESGFLELPITARHAATVYTLPNVHRDPFDRILIAQAISEPLQLLTFDKVLAEYTDLVNVIIN